MKSKIKILPVLLTFLSFLYSEEKGALFYHGVITELKDSTIKVPDETVALYRRIRVQRPDTTTIIWQTPSIFFIIDHSGSMCYDYDSTNPNSPMDQWGKRFTVTLEFIDSIIAKFPGAEVGIAVLREHLYFDSADSSYFEPLTAYPQGAFVPFFKLDSAYLDHGGDPGYYIIRNILQTDTVLADNDPLSNASEGYKYLNLKYWPTNYQHNSTNTNINAGFDAAKHAFQSALYPRNRQFIIFFSDGEANVANGPHSNPNDFVHGDRIPTTFTIFFNKQSAIPQSIQTMTNNIQTNGWSLMNSKSKVWSIDPNNQDLMKLIMDSIMINMPQELLFIPTYITINGIKLSDYDTINNCFTFDEHFPLTAAKTDFVYKINYLVPKDSIVPNGDTIVVAADSTIDGTFSVVVNSTVDKLPNWYPDIFEIVRWDRSLGFYYKNALFQYINMGMDTLELRFTEKKIDILYGCESVYVTITNTNGNIDSETFHLSKTDSCLTKSFALVVDSTPTQNDGILQLFDSDTVTAVFRNTKLPLDTLELKVPFYPTTSINPNYLSNQKVLSLNIINSSILFNLPISGKTKLHIYNINGRLISALVDSYKHSGEYGVHWDSEKFGAGIYFLKLSANGSSVSRKVTIIK